MCFDLSDYAVNLFYRPALYSSGLGNQTRSPGYFSNSWTRQDQSAVLPDDSGKKFVTNLVDSQVHKSARSPPLQNETSQENPHFIQHDYKRYEYEKESDKYLDHCHFSKGILFLCLVSNVSVAVILEI